MGGILGGTAGMGLNCSGMAKTGPMGASGPIGIICGSIGVGDGGTTGGSIGSLIGTNTGSMSMGSLWITTGLSNCVCGGGGSTGLAGCLGLVKSGTLGMTGLVSGIGSILLNVGLFSGLKSALHMGRMLATIDGQSQTLVMG